MRAIKTFVLHLYLDTEAPERVCGDVRPLEDPESYPFKNPIEFETLLRRLAGKPLAPKTPPPGADE